jgi:nucleoprotein TPR
MAAAAVDTAYLASSYSIPETSIHNLLHNPTTELVASLLEQLLKKAHEFDSLNSEKLRAEVALENAVRTSETRARALKATVEKGLNEVEQLRKELNSKGI